MIVKMKLERETKGTYVYTSVDMPSAVPTIYIRKDQVDWTKPPATLDVKFEAVE